MAIELTNPTRITIGNVDVTPFVRSIRIASEAVEKMSNDLARIAIRFPQLNLRFRGGTRQLPPRFYRQVIGRNHPRIRRMHAAYRQRRQGRW